MMGHREPIKNGCEWDVVSRYWRHLYCYLAKPRVAHGIKKIMSRRVRRETRRTLSKGDFHE